MAAGVGHTPQGSRHRGDSGISLVCSAAREPGGQPAVGMECEHACAHGPSPLRVHVGRVNAIRRRVFEELQIREAWSQGVSDDWLLTQALRSAGLPIRFVPDGVVPTQEPCTWRGLVEWTTRQASITRVYAPETWRVVLFLHSAYLVLGILGLMAMITGRWMAGGALLSHWVFSGLGSRAVCRAALHRLATHGCAIAQRTWPQALWGPAVTALILVNLAVSRVTRTIRWRGISYTMLSPSHVLVQRDTRTPTAPLAPQAVGTPRLEDSVSRIEEQP